MKAVWLLALALLQTGSPAPDDDSARHLHTQRSVQVPPETSGQVCAVLDAAVYAHAESESLNDLRLFASGPAANTRETPFILTESNTDRAESEPATVRNLGMQGDAIVFDLRMPQRPYTGVELTLDTKDFIGSATISGRTAEGREIALGEFALFDLSVQHLSRSTFLPLQESTFPELHLRLQLQAAPGLPTKRFSSGIVTGASIPPSRFAQTLYTTVASVSTWNQHGHNTVATLRLPPHVPVAHIVFTLDPAYKSNFLRDATVTAKPNHPEPSEGENTAASGVEVVPGQISRVHVAAGQTSTAGQLPIDSVQLGFDTVLAANLRGSATVEVSVANGNDSPLPLRAVQLQMRERRICFDAEPGVTAYTLLYGDRELAAPVYDYSRLFVARPQPVQATLGPEQPNPRFVPRADARPFSERHPELLWLGLLGALAALGGVALRSMRQQRGAAR